MLVRTIKTTYTASHLRIRLIICAVVAGDQASMIELASI
jgi:hypothetical protein